MQVDFYHLTQLPLERALPRIAERVVETGGRLLIVAGEASQRGEHTRRGGGCSPAAPLRSPLRTGNAPPWAQQKTLGH